MYPIVCPNVVVLRMQQVRKLLRKVGGCAEEYKQKKNNEDIRTNTETKAMKKDRTSKGQKDRQKERP